MPKVWNKRDPNTPKDAVYVGRPSKWGNPWKIGDAAVDECGLTIRLSRSMVVERYRAFIEDHHYPERKEIVRRELRGKDLVCWCAPAACHADVLLEVANE